MCVTEDGEAEGAHSKRLHCSGRDNLIDWQYVRRQGNITPRAQEPGTVRICPVQTINRNPTIRSVGQNPKKKIVDLTSA